MTSDPRWQGLARRRRTLVRYLMLAPVWFVLALVIQVVWIALVGQSAVTPLSALAVVYVLGLWLLEIRRSFWPCPRCQRPFHWSILYRNPWAKKCVHCGLEKWSPLESERARP